MNVRTALWSVNRAVVAAILSGVPAATIEEEVRRAVHEAEARRV